MSDAKNTLRLTVENIRAMTAGDELHDHVIKGLSLRKKAAAWSWHLYYRDARGDRRRPKLGEYPSLGLEPAREAAKKLKQAVARGEDPSADKQAAREAMRVRDAATKYLAEHVAGRLEPSSVYLYTHTLNTMCAAIGGLRLAEVTPMDLERAHRRFGGPYAVNNARRIFRAMWRTAADKWRLELPACPVAGTDPNPDVARERIATPAELRAIVAELDRRRVEYPERVALIFCLMFTGARLSELVHARHSQFVEGEHGRRLVLQKHKTSRRTGKPREIEWPAQALAEVAALPLRRDGRVFGQITRHDPAGLWEQVRACHPTTADLTLHDLRRTFASHGDRVGLSLRATGQLLGHASAKTTERYAYLFGDAKAEGAQAIADRVAATLDPGK